MLGEYDGKCVGLGVGLAVGCRASTHFFLLHTNPEQHDSGAFFLVEPHSCATLSRSAHFWCVGLEVGGGEVGLFIG